MSTNREDINNWIKEGEAQGANYLLVFKDTLIGTIFPVWVMPGDDLTIARNQYGGKLIDEIKLKPKNI